MFFDLDLDRMIDLSSIKSFVRFHESGGVWCVSVELHSGGVIYLNFKDETDCALFWDSIPRITDKEEK